MVKQSSILKKLLFGIALCVVPMGLCAMTTGKRVMSGKKTAKVTPIDEEVMPCQTIPSKAFQSVAAAAGKMDRPDSPHVLVSSSHKEKIDAWVQKNPCLHKELCDDTFATIDDKESTKRRVSASAPVSGRGTPMQAFSNGKMSSSSSQNSQLSQTASVEDRLLSLERVVEDTSLETTDSVVRYHEQLNALFKLSDDGAKMISKGKFAQKVDEKIESVSKAVLTLDCRQQCVQEKIATLQQQLSDSTAALKVQKEATEALTSNLKEKDENVVDMKQTVNTLATQVVLLQKIVEQQSRPWWKRYFGCCSKRSDVDEDESVKNLSFQMKFCDNYAQTDPIAQ